MPTLGADEDLCVVQVEGPGYGLHDPGRHRARLELAAEPRKGEHELVASEPR